MVWAAVFLLQALPLAAQGLLPHPSFDGGSWSNPAITGGTSTGHHLTAPTITGGTSSGQGLTNPAITGGTSSGLSLTTPTITGGTLSGGDISGQTVAPTGIAGSARTLAATLGQVLAPNWNAPVFQASVLGGVVADDGTDQSGNIILALGALDLQIGHNHVGGKLQLPCGNLKISGPVLLSGNRITLGSADNAFCSHLNADPSFLSGDFLTVTGVYSGIEGLAFDVMPTPAQTAGNITPFRTGGYTVNMRGGYNFLTRASMRGCFECVEMASTGESSLVRDVVMEFIADGATHPGSGGIDVTNQGIGPENWIEDVYILPNYGAATVYRPSYGIRLVNSGATHMRGNDVTGVANSLVIAPGSGQTVQATFSSNNVWDAATNCVTVNPSGSGYVFHATFDEDWCTAIVPGGYGLGLIGANATPPASRPASIMGVKWRGGVIASTAGQSGTGFLVDGPNSIDSELTEATVAGWQFGFNLGAGARHITIADNHDGNYSPFDLPPGGSASNNTNNFGGNVAAGAGDWINIHDNLLYGNTSGPLSFAATGIHNRVHNNSGYNPVGTSVVSVGPSPSTFTAGPTATSLYIKGGTVSSVTLDGATLCSTTPCQLELAPYQSAVTNYTAAPVFVQNVH